MNKSYYFISNKEFLRLLLKDPSHQIMDHRFWKNLRTLFGHWWFTFKHCFRACSRDSYFYRHVTHRIHPPNWLFNRDLSSY